MFRRGNGPLVSVLMPTRGRAEGLCKAIDSLNSLAKDKSLIEYVFRADDDDTETINAINWMETILPVKKIIGPRGNDYHDMHLWVTEMSKVATGDWLFLFNDDAKMATQDWDQILLNININQPWHEIQDVCCLAVPTMDNPYAEEFMFLRRKVVEILGHYSLIPHNDTWIKTMLRMVNSFFFFPAIAVDHLVQQTDDVIRKEGLPARETLEYTVKGKGYTVKKLEDAIKLQQHIDAEMEKAEKVVKMPPSMPAWTPPSNDVFAKFFTSR